VIINDDVVGSIGKDVILSEDAVIVTTGADGKSLEVVLNNLWGEDTKVVLGYWSAGLWSCLD
jgi:hypothetical protein